ncbi:transporter substrate-binding domain-containing protein [Actinomycetaceae bacterium MB13-C1-2]|nr:transporter substrate-binding domain-containing protein [Actinomycetaceae bacterium MB13-C1-2]
MAISLTRSTKSFAKRLGVGAMATVAALSMAACSNGSSGSTSEESGESEDIQAVEAENTSDADALPTVVPGKFTVATGEPAFSPWVENDDPASGEGLEAAVAYAVAEQLGFARENVVWIRTPFDTVISPGPKDFDVNLQQFSISEERLEAVDFSSPYYVTTQAIVSLEGNAGADAKTLADLKDVKFGVAVGSNGAAVIEEKVAPNQEIGVFNSNDDAVAALQAGQIDAIVTDLPTVLYLQAAVLDNGVVVGQFEPVEGDGDEFAFLLPKDSGLTAPVTAAVDALRADGTLDALAEKWIAEGAGAPVLK